MLIMICNINEYVLRGVKMKKDLTFGERLAAERKLKGFTSQKAFATELGVSPVSISHWENDERKPDYEMFAKIADTLDVSYDYLLGKSISKKRDNINIAERIGLNDTAIETLEEAKVLTEFLNDTANVSFMELSTGLNNMLNNRWFWTTFFHNLHCYTTPSEWGKVEQALYDNGIASDITAQTVFLTGMLEAIKKLGEWVIERK